MKFTGSLQLFFIAMLFNAVVEAAENYVEIRQERPLSDKYREYQTTIPIDNQAQTIDWSASAGFSGKPRSNMIGQQELLNFKAFSPVATSGNEDFQNMFNSLFNREDFGNTATASFDEIFRGQFQQGFSRPDTLFHQITARSYDNNSSSGNRSGNANGSAGDTRQASRATGSGYDMEQPAVIRWFFAVIGYVRDNPVSSALVALSLLGLISLMQHLFRRFARPFG